MTDRLYAQMLIIEYDPWIQVENNKNTNVGISKSQNNYVA